PAGQAQGREPRRRNLQRGLHRDQEDSDCFRFEAEFQRKRGAGGAGLRRLRADARETLAGVAKVRQAAPPHGWLTALIAAPRSATERRRPETVVHRASGASPRDASVQGGEWPPR